MVTAVDGSRLTNRQIKAAFWPDVYFYDKQWEAIESVELNVETHVVACHQVGKDFLTGFTVVSYFLRHWPCRIVTTSVKDDHLRVLWGEIGWFIENARRPLSAKAGGPLLIKHRDILRKMDSGSVCPISYLRGMVSLKGEGLAGHHARHTLFVGDEASGIDNEAIERARTWAKRLLLIGNPYSCENAFKIAVEEGDILAN